MTKVKPCSTCHRMVYAQEMISIPVAEYRELQRRPSREGGYLGKRSRARLAHDPELAAYMIGQAEKGTMILRDIRLAAIERFGADRVPSNSAVHRFLQEAARIKSAANRESGEQ